MDPFRLDGQLALITGASSGLGLATARALIDAGARVVLTGRHEDTLREAAAGLGPGAFPMVHDVSDLDSIPGLVQTIESQIGPLHILVNNAGIHLKKPAVDTADADLARVINTHVSGAFALSRECGRLMIERRTGSIIMILSMAALFGIPQVSAYSAAKSALLGLTRALAGEYSPFGVRVNAIAPGWIDTPMSRRAFQGDPERRQKVLERTPLGRLGDAMDVGYAAVYLNSPAAGFLTGVVLPVDGGVNIGF